jgi:CRISPR-associated protein Cas2
MTMTVVTLSNVPASLRGALTKWMQEISTGVYVGNLSSRVREELWERVTQSVGKGQATLSYATNNELGYQFVMYRTKQVNVHFDGIPLVMVPIEQNSSVEMLGSGFSKQAKYRYAKKFSNNMKEKQTENQVATDPYIILDIETDGLDPMEDNIIEIAALRIVEGKIEKEYTCLICNKRQLPREIVELTGITDEILADKGIDISEALAKLLTFIGNLPIVGYNLRFDIEFINEKLRDVNVRVSDSGVN